MVVNRKVVEPRVQQPRLKICRQKRQNACTFMMAACGLIERLLSVVTIQGNCSSLPRLHPIPEILDADIVGHLTLSLSNALYREIFVCNQCNQPARVFPYTRSTMFTNLADCGSDLTARHSTPLSSLDSLCCQLVTNSQLATHYDHFYSSSVE